MPRDNIFHATLEYTLRGMICILIYRYKIKNNRILICDHLR